MGTNIMTNITRTNVMKNVKWTNIMSHASLLLFMSQTFRGVVETTSIMGCPTQTLVPEAFEEVT